MTIPRLHSNDDVLARLRTLDRRYPDALTMDRFCRETGIGSTTIQRRFGGWLALRTLAGLQRRKSHLVNGRVHSQEELLVRLRIAVKHFGKFITQQEFCQWAEVSPNTLHTYCGSWRKLRAALGLPERRLRQRLYADVELFEELSRLIRQLGRWPSSEEINRHGRFSYATYAERFGGMRGLRRSLERFREACRSEWARRQSAKPQASLAESSDHPPR